jgi:hypothetical protein
MERTQEQNIFNVANAQEHYTRDPHETLLAPASLEYDRRSEASNLHTD